MYKPARLLLGMAGVKPSRDCFCLTPILNLDNDKIVHQS